MIRIALLSVSLLAVCVLAVGASAQGTCKLTYADFTSPTDRLSDFVRRGLEPLARDQIKGLPKGIGPDPAFFTTKIGELPVHILIDPAKPSKAYVDTDADFDFADEKAVKGVEGRKPWTVFLGFPAVTLGKSQVRFAVYSVILQEGEGRPTVRYGCIGPSGTRSGTATLDGRKCAIALLDTDFDGRYKVGVDLLAIDANSDGRFEPAALEVMQAAEVARVAGVFYAVTLEPDGSAITFAAPTFKFGALKVSSDGIQVGLVSRWGNFLLNPSERNAAGAWPLPVGTYTLRRLTLVAQDESGTVWTLRGLSPPKTSEFQITEGNTFELVLGPPLTLKSEVTIEKGTVSLNVRLVGQAGETYLPGAYKGDEQQPAPTYRILDEKGNELTSGKFEYG